MKNLLKGLSIKRSLLERYESLNAQLEEENLKLQAELIAVKEELKLTRNRPYIDLDLGDPIPDDISKRMLYVATAAGAHKDLYGPKIKSLINVMREDFSKVNRNAFGYTQAEYDLYLKGAINGFWLLYEWGESMINEQVANQTEEPEILDDETLKELKDKTE
jgi:hypothetical protein